MTVTSPLSRIRSALLVPVALAAALAAGCDSPPPPVRDPCETDAACAERERCSNGTCAPLCAGDGDCHPTEYCDASGDGACHPRVLAPCPEVECAASQTCVQGYCTTPPERACAPGESKDGCGPSEVCVADPNGTLAEGQMCYPVPHCAEDGSCPPGELGAVCNDGAFPDKYDVCLIGRCRSGAHCPAGRSCVAAGDGLGVCSDGALGAPCTADEHCATGSCFAPIAGELGLCS